MFVVDPNNFALVIDVVHYGKVKLFVFQVQYNDAIVGNVKGIRYEWHKFNQK